MQGGTLEVVSAKDGPSICQEDLNAVLSGPFTGLPDD